MQRHKVLMLLASCSTAVAAPALAQTTGDAPGSPSAANATVSPATVAQAFDDARTSETNFDLSIGTSYAGGDFGAARDTTLLSTAVAARYSTGGLTLTASIPYMRIRSNGIVFAGIDSTPLVVAGGTGRRRTNDGMGDLSFGAAYVLPFKPAGLDVELAGRVKVPTATKASNLSSRRTDYSGGIQVTKVTSGISPFASATYRVFGDPRWINLRNGFAASAGASAPIGRRSVVLVSYHYAEAASRLIRDSHEAFLGASHTLDPAGRIRLNAYATAGLSRSAADASGGLSLSFKI